MDESTDQANKQTNKQNERTPKFILGKVILKPLRPGGFAGVISLSRDVYCLCIVPLANLWPWLYVSHPFACRVFVRKERFRVRGQNLELNVADSGPIPSDPV